MLILPELYAQSPAIDFYRAAVRFERLVHAYAWMGSDTQALYQSALWLAAGLNCEQSPEAARDKPPLTPCGACRPCKWIANNAHPQVMTLSPLTYPDPDAKPSSSAKKQSVSASATSIKVGQVNRLLGELGTRAKAGQWRVVIVTHASALKEPDDSEESHQHLDQGLNSAVQTEFNLEALGSGRSIANPPEFNAPEGTRFCALPLTRSVLKDDSANRLLKTLEEPGAYTLFLFLTDAEQSLLPTIASRCQWVRFQAGNSAAQNAPETTSSFHAPTQVSQNLLAAQAQFLPALLRPMPDYESRVMQWFRALPANAAGSETRALLQGLKAQLWHPEAIAHRAAYAEQKSTLMRLNAAEQQLKANVSAELVLCNLFAGAP
ncbi:MAG: hypothetical protein VKJ06_03260 [Vampirovibrionales bacterium]|nr:hypothetical protein [Vampirovibrionales bacterium]